MSGFALLSFVHSLVEADAAPAGFVGTVALGVSGLGHTLWWCGSFGRRKSTSFSARAPASPVSATLLLGEEEASALLHGLRLSESDLVCLSGDRILLDRFFSRYLGSVDLLSLRARKP